MSADRAKLLSYCDTHSSALSANSDGDRRPMEHKLHVVDSSGLTDADWAAVNRVNRAYEAAGIDAFCDELERLDDEVLQVTVAGAFFPALIRELLEDQMAEHGLTFDDLREILRKAERPREQ
jgi:hypothetical protein